MKRINATKYQFQKAVLLLGTALLFISCEINEGEKLGELNKNFSDRTIIDADLTYTDSGKVRMLLKAPLIEEFTLIDSPYTLMKKGVDIKFWNNRSDQPNRLTANWAKLNDKKKFYEGRGDVEMINNDGDTLRTQLIFWDNKNRKIYTEDTVTIKRKDGTVNKSNHGMLASEDFKEFTFLDNHGIFMVDEEKRNRVEPTENQSQEKKKAPKGLKELKLKPMKENKKLQ